MLKDINTPKYSKTALLNSFRRRNIIDLEQNEVNDHHYSQNNPHFQRFFFDVYWELEKFGPIKTINVCNNISPHLRGSVYVTYKSINDTIQCYRNLNGRFYAGWPLVANFCFIGTSKENKCSYSYKCPRVLDCNFLHFYSNPSVKKRSRSPNKA
jgi:splicing factor U2AF 35 kDa subunit